MTSIKDAVAAVRASIDAIERNLIDRGAVPFHSHWLRQQFEELVALFPSGWSIAAAPSPAVAIADGLSTMLEESREIRTMLDRSIKQLTDALAPPRIDRDTADVLSAARWEAEFHKLAADNTKLRATLARPHMVWAAEQNSAGIDIQKEDARIREELALARAVRNAARAESNRLLIDRRENGSILSAVDAAIARAGLYGSMTLVEAIDKLVAERDAAVASRAKQKNARADVQQCPPGFFCDHEPRCPGAANK